MVSYLKYAELAQFFQEVRFNLIPSIGRGAENITAACRAQPEAP